MNAALRFRHHYLNYFTIETTSNFIKSQLTNTISLRTCEENTVLGECWGSL